MLKIIYKIRFLSFIILFIFLSYFSNAVYAICPSGNQVTIGDFNWDSSNFHVAIVRTILEEGYGCEVDVITSSTVPILLALSKNEVNFVMEIWDNTWGESWKKYAEQNLVKKVGVNFEGAYEGWFVPKYVIEGDSDRGIEPFAPDLKTVFDLKKYKDIFRDREEPTKGRFLNCPVGWTCEETNKKRLVAYGLADDFTSFEVGTAAALDAEIVRSYKRGIPILFYYWQPTWMFAQYELIQLEEPEYDEAIFDEFLASKNPNKTTALPKQDVAIAVNVKWSENNPQIIEFLNKYETTLYENNQALLYMEKNDTDPESAAENFLKTNDKWHEWVSQEARDAIIKSLS